MRRFTKAFFLGLAIGTIGYLATPATFGIIAVALLSLAAGIRFIAWGIADPLAAEPQLYIAALFAGEGITVLLFNFLVKIYGN